MSTNSLQIQSVGPITTSTGSKYVNVIITNSNAIGSIIDSALSAGDNVVVVPTNAVNATILPVSTNTATLKLKGAVPDTGVTLHATLPSSISLASAQTSFIINASVGTSVEITFI